MIYKGPYFLSVLGIKLDGVVCVHNGNNKIRNIFLKQCPLLKIPKRHRFVFSTLLLLHAVVAKPVRFINYSVQTFRQILLRYQKRKTATHSGSVYKFGAELNCFPTAKNAQSLMNENDSTLRLDCKQSLTPLCVIYHFLRIF